MTEITERKNGQDSMMTRRQNNYGRQPRYGDSERLLCFANIVICCFYSSQFPTLHKRLPSNFSTWCLSVTAIYQEFGGSWALYPLTPTLANIGISIKHLVANWVKPSFVIFDIRAL